MSLNDNYIPTRVSASAGQTVVTVDWLFNTASELVVMVNDVLQVLTTDYTVVLPTSFLSPNGTVTFLVALAASDIVLIQRSTPLLQSTDFASSGAFSAQTIEDAFDKGMIIAQELGTGLMVALPDGDTSPDVTRASVAVTDPSGAAAITTFDGGELMQDIIIILKNSDYTFTAGTFGTAGDLVLLGGVDFTTGVVGDCIQFVYDGVNWIECARSINS